MNVVAQANRQAVVFAGADLFARRETIARKLRRCVRDEPHILWQFVLAPETEEPLDLLDDLVAELRRLPGHWLDRLVSPPGRRRLAARRLFVRLPRGAHGDPGWAEEAEALLATLFH